MRQKYRKGDWIKFQPSSFLQFDSFSLDARLEFVPPVGFTDEIREIAPYSEHSILLKN